MAILAADAAFDKSYVDRLDKRDAAAARQQVAHDARAREQ